MRLGPSALIQSKRVVLRILFGGGLGYLLVVLGMFLAQRSLMFPAPDHFAPVPAGFERVSLRTADGLDLAAVYRPAGAGQPTLVFFHGNGDNWAGAAKATSALVDASIGALLPEYRGYGENPGKPSEVGLFSDGRAAIAWLAARGIGRERMVIVGNSLGSGVALQMALESPPAALILISPFTSMTDVVAEHYRWLPARWLLRDRFDNLAKIDRVTAPVLALHGEADALIPFEQSVQLARANPRMKLISFGDVGHELAYLTSAQVAELAWLRMHWAKPVTRH